MGNNVRTLYLYVVAFITLGMLVGGIVSTVNNITSYFYPDSDVFFEEENSSKNYNYYDDYENDEDEEINKNEIKKENYKAEKMKNTVVSVAVFIVGGIMYKYHWNIIEKERIK